MAPTEPRRGNVTGESRGLEDLLTVRDLERRARALLPKSAYDYFRSGSDSERTLRANVAAYRRWNVWYRVLVDVAERTLETTVLGGRVAFPILVAPTAYHRMAHADGECGTARAAAAVGTIYTASTLATTSLEQIASIGDGRRWFQLYVHKDRGFTRELVSRAEASGYEAIVLTVDTPLLGRRLLDERNAFKLPDGLEMANLVGAKSMRNVDRSMLAAYVASRHDASLAWSDVDWLTSLTSLPVILKGIVHPADAARSTAHGVRAIIVSNHGGRQMDGAPPTLEALPRVVDAIAGRCEVLVDGGVRWGVDVLIALALGARAVMLGRPVLWALAAGGEEGVRRLLTGMRDDLSRCMALAGVSDVRSIGRDLVHRRFRAPRRVRVSAGIVRR